MNYELMNLDLGANPPERLFAIGPYAVRLVDNYEVLQANLSSARNVKQTPIFNEGGEEWNTVVTEPKVGSNAVTAIVECTDEPDAFLTNGEEKGIWDLCLILSYLSGRNIFLPKDERRYTHINHGFSVVPLWQIPKAAEVAWQNRKTFSSESEMRPLWYILRMNSSSDAEIKLLLGCVSLEIIQTLEKEITAEPKSDELEELLQTLKDEIERSNLEKDLKDRLKGTVGKWGSASSTQAFKSLLIKYGLIQADISGLPLKRVDGINRMRNGVVHKGEVRLPNWIQDHEIQITVSHFIAARFIPALIMDYLNRKFELGRFNWVQRNTGILGEYIYKGTHEGDLIEVA